MIPGACSLCWYRAVGGEAVGQPQTNVRAGLGVRGLPGVQARPRERPGAKNVPRAKITL
jgi:hypothetical protein